MTAFFNLKRMSAIVIAAGLAACSTQDPEQDRRETAEPRAPVAGEGGGDVRDGELEVHEVRSAQTGLASWYGEPFHGRPTASGEIFDQAAMTAAHRTLPLRSPGSHGWTLAKAFWCASTTAVLSLRAGSSTSAGPPPLSSVSSR